MGKPTKLAIISDIHANKYALKGLILCWWVTLITSYIYPVNPESISITRKPLTSFCVMEIGDNCLNINFKNIPYDYSKLKEDFLERNVIGKEFFMNYFHSFL